MKLRKQLEALAFLKFALETEDMELWKKYLYLDATAKTDILNHRVLFALTGGNDTTEVYLNEDYALLAAHFKWTPIEHVRGKGTLLHKGIREFYIPKPTEEVVTLLETELMF
ncbi:MAG: hypothetical protein WC878_07660 [Candidatus Paceibacterota bacterium]|jgi:hypothetical protein